MLASSRERRSNAGAKMTQLLENFDENDDFYKSTYGGFQEEEHDQGFSPAESESDYVDSDFDIDETDEPAEKEEDIDAPAAKKRLTVTKAYREPVFAKPPKKIDPATTKPKPSEALVEYKTPVRPPKRKPGSPELETHSTEKKLRASTLRKSVLSEKQRREAELKELNRRKKAVARVPHRRLTQREILDEAAITERQNLRSLARHQQFELEQERKRRAKMTKRRTIVGAFIRYHSRTMPLMKEILVPDDSHVTLEDNDSSGASTAAVVSAPLRSTVEVGKQERTFISFNSNGTFYDTFPAAKRVAEGKPQRAVRVRGRQYCPVTGLPAKYLDPLTKQPYANPYAFAVIREAFYRHLQQTGDRSDPKVREWLRYHAPEQTD